MYDPNHLGKALKSALFNLIMSRDIRRIQQNSSMRYVELRVNIPKHVDLMSFGQRINNEVDGVRWVRFSVFDDENGDNDDDFIIVTISIFGYGIKFWDLVSLIDSVGASIRAVDRIVYDYHEDDDIGEIVDVTKETIYVYGGD